MVTFLSGITYLSHDQLLNLASRLYGTCSTLLGNDSGVKRILNQIEISVDLFSKALSRDIAHPLTPVLRKLDSRRDGLYNAIKFQVLSFSEVVEESETFEAAHRIIEVLKKYGWNLERSDISETEQLNRLIAELDSPTVISSVTKLGLEQRIARLKSVNTEFSKCLAQRSSERGVESVEMITARKKLIRAIRSLIAFIDVVSHDESAQQFKDAAMFCDEVMTEIRALSKAQATRKANVNEPEVTEVR